LAVVGNQPERFVAEFCRAARRAAPKIDSAPVWAGGRIFWGLDGNTGPIRARIKPAERRPAAAEARIVRGDLGRARSFFFRGPEGKLNLRASNLDMFVQLAEGLDDETWLYHLRRHDYSDWMRQAVGHAELVESVHGIETQKDASATDTRASVRKLIEEHFRLPVTPPSDNGAPSGRGGNPATQSREAVQKHSDQQAPGSTGG
jgi:hypothetical protein